MVNSTLCDSDDENQINIRKDFRLDPKTFTQRIQTLGKTTSYPVTAILTELDNRILLDEQIDNIYQQYKDPLQFQINRFQNKINFLKSEKELTKNTINYLEGSSLNPNSNFKADKGQLITQHQQKILDLKAKKRHITII